MFCLYVRTPHSCPVPAEIKREFNHIELELKMVEPTCGCWERSPGPLKKQVHLTTGPSLQLPKHGIFNMFIHIVNTHK